MRHHNQLILSVNITIRERRIRTVSAIMTNENPDEYFDAIHNYPSPTVGIPITMAVLLLLFPVMVLEWLHHKPARSRNGRLTKRLMIGVIAFNTIQHLVYATKWLGCINCGMLWGSFWISKAVVKGINLLFLIHRAKLVRGMAPVLSKKWFETILPAIIGVIVIVFILAILYSLRETVWVCVTYDDWYAVKTCTRSSDEKVRESGKMTGAFGIGVDAVVTTFLMVLFTVPLYRVYHADISVLNENQLKERKKLKDLLIWSVVLTFINQVTSSFHILLMVHSSAVTEVLFIAGMFDPAINIWTAWLMVTRNRQYLQRIYSSTCCDSSVRIKRPSVALTDIPSKSGNISDPMSLQLSITPTPTVCHRHRQERILKLSDPSSPESRTSKQLKVVFEKLVI